MRLTLLATLLIPTVISSIVPATQAVQLRDGKVYFVQPPRLLKTATTYDDVGVWGATYYFTVSLPQNAGEPLQRITINQHSGLDTVRFDLKASSAAVGKQKLQLQDVVISDKKTISLTFAPPVEPGKTITVALKPKYNPVIEGVYLFGVTAFPLGEKSHGQFLGYGRLHFYRDSDFGRSPFWW